ncbi:MAG: deaminase [Micrococcaceae bacterium]|nr:deaminase [Micrococcaceae bacterium]
MAKLIYSGIASLDGYTVDAQGNFDWSAPDEQVHAFINDRERSVGTYLFGRRMYEVMSYWESSDILADESPIARDFAQIWQAANKVVYSTTLDRPITARTRLERSFDPDTVRQLKEVSPSDLSIGGPELAAQALRAGLVDECQLYLVPVAVGGGTPYLPAGLRVPLELVQERRFEGGTVFLQYRVTGQPVPESDWKESADS